MKSGKSKGSRNKQCPHVLSHCLQEAIFDDVNDLEGRLGLLILKLQHTWTRDRRICRRIQQELEGLWAQPLPRDDRLTQLLSYSMLLCTWCPCTNF